MASKASQPNHYRKGKDIQVGDMVAIEWSGTKATSFSPVVSVELVDPALVGQKGSKQYRATLANGATRTTTAGGYIEGQYA
jgi:hypothetical protein